jgi:hypothetical protein
MDGRDDNDSEKSAAFNIAQVMEAADSSGM